MQSKQPFPALLVAVASCLVLFLASVSASAALVIDADRQFDYAHSRLKAGAYDEAVVEFNRFVYFFPADARTEEARFQIGTAHFKAGRFSEAAAVFDRLTGAADNTTWVAEAYFMLSRSHAGAGRIEQAMVDLHNLMAVSSDPEILDRARYELGWLWIDQGRWVEAVQTVSKITAENAGRYRVARLKKDLARSDHIPKKNPTTAGLLSILPGAGQAYCGRYQDAVTALLVNAGLIWAAWEAFDNELYALGGVIAFVETGFYAGNIYGAVSSAHKHNRDHISDFRERLIQTNRVYLSLGPVSTGLSLSLKVDF